METMLEMARVMPDLFSSTNPDLADILGNTYFDFENLYDPRFLNFQVPGLPDLRLSAGIAGSGPGVVNLDGFPEISGDPSNEDKKRDSITVNTF